MIPLSLLTSLATIQRAVVSSDAVGGTVRTWPNRLTGVPCRISSVSAREQAEFSRADTVVTNKIYFGSDISLLKEDRVNVGSNSYLVKAYSGTITPDGSTGLFTAFVESRDLVSNP